MAVLEVEGLATYRVPAFMAHLCNPLGLIEPGIDDEVLSPLWDDGTWTGTLVWDSAVHACEMILKSAEWRARLARPASVLELGCGLGVPGLICHALGASPVLLTDREMVASLVSDGLAANAILPSKARAVEFAWSDEAAVRLMSEHLNGKSPDVLIACDCIFQPIFGSAFLLLQMLLALCGPETVVLLALERRADDGAEAFFEQAASAGFESSVRLRKDRVIVCEMVLRGEETAS